MSNNPQRTPTDLTLDYYDVHAASFARQTVGIDFSPVQDRFAALLPSGASILDFGCGSGRDAKHFLDAGFVVAATDGSSELCSLAQQLTGIPIRNELFQDLSDREAYDGIWACSSVLHLPKDELSSVFALMAQALKPHGIIYASFKYGTFEGVRNGRHFTDFTELTFRAFLTSVSDLVLEDFWITTDVRPGREDETWLNVTLRKT